MINKNKRHANLVLKSRNIKTIKFSLIYFTLVIVLSVITLSSSFAATPAPTYETDESSIFYPVVAVPTLPVTSPIITPNLLPTTIPTPTNPLLPTPLLTPESTDSIIDAIILPSPTSELTTPLPTAAESSMYQILLALLTILSFVGVVVSMILLITNRIKKRRIKPYIIAFLISLAIFIISALFFVSIG